MKRSYKNLAVAACVALGMSACESKLDVTNPNYFTDEDIQENILKNGTEAQKKMVLEGMVNTMQNQILLSDASFAGGFSNDEMHEYTFERKRFLQSSDVVEGAEATRGSYWKYYTNDPSNPIWERSQVAPNYGYYLGPVKRISNALHPLAYLSDDETVSADPLLSGYRAQCMVIKALGYIQLMERYTDLQDVTSDTKQGWPIYDTWGYNNPKEPLSVVATWDWIKTTLKGAVADFKRSSIGNNGYTVAAGATDATVHDIDCAVAQFELARAGLDSKDWDVVIEACKDLLSHYPNFISPDNYGMKASLLPELVKRNDNGWCGIDFNATENAFYNIDKNPEVIWGTTRGSASYFWGIFNALKQTPSGFHQVDANIYKKLSDNDCRKACILAEKFDDYLYYTYQGNDTTWYKYTMPAYTSLKWAASSAIGYENHTNAKTTSDLIYLRSSAAWLMLAEAYAQSGQEGKAKETLNKLLAARTITGAPAMTCDNTMQGMTVMDMVKLQWRIEMWGEADWAFFNMKRWNEVPARGENQWSKNTVTIPHMTWEIPQPERQGNPYWRN